MQFTALILAAQRPGILNPLAEKHGVSHKCLIDMEGLPMIERVIISLQNAKSISKIIISTDDPSALKALPIITKGIQDKSIECVKSGGNLFESIGLALSNPDDFPFLICTADNALQTTDMVDDYCQRFAKEPCDASAGVTPAETIWAKYPEGQRRPYTLTDGRFSSCNLFAVRSKDALNAASVFAGGGQFGKSLMRILAAFGPLSMILYRMRRLSLDGAFKRISKAVGLTVRPIIMPYAEAPIDVDNDRTERIAREILAKGYNNITGLEKENVS